MTFEQQARGAGGRRRLALAGAACRAARRRRGQAAAPAAAAVHAAAGERRASTTRSAATIRCPTGVTVVSRDWFSGEAAADPAYSICYVNAFQTQANEAGIDRPDERTNWPRRLVLSKLGDDPNWGGEYLVDIRNASKRERAADWVGQMIEGCADKGFEAVEFDNLDSWTRFDGTPLAKKVPVRQARGARLREAARRRAHALGLAVGQKNTADVTRGQAAPRRLRLRDRRGVRPLRECDRYRSVYGDRVIEIEYRRKDFDRPAATVGDEISIVLRDRLVSTPGQAAVRLRLLLESLAPGLLTRLAENAQLSNVFRQSAKHQRRA